MERQVRHRRIADGRERRCDHVERRRDSRGGDDRGERAPAHRALQTVQHRGPEGDGRGRGRGRAIASELCRSPRAIVGGTLPDRPANLDGRHGTSGRFGATPSGCEPPSPKWYRAAPMRAWLGSPALPRGLDGLPVAPPLEGRVSRAVLLIATAWFGLCRRVGDVRPAPRGTLRIQRQHRDHRGEHAPLEDRRPGLGVHRGAADAGRLLLPPPLGHLLDRRRGAEGLRPPRLRVPPAGGAAQRGHATAALRHRRAASGGLPPARGPPWRSWCCRSRSRSRASTRSRCR